MIKALCDVCALFSSADISGAPLDFAIQPLVSYWLYHLWQVQWTLHLYAYETGSGDICKFCIFRVRSLQAEMVIEIF